MPTIDNLDIQIKASSKIAVKSLDDLITRLNNLQTSLSSVQTNGISGLASGLNALANSTHAMNSIDARTFSKIAREINKLSTIDYSGVSNTANSVNSIAQAFSTLSSYQSSFQSISDLATAVSRLGYKSVQTAIQNIPQLSSAMLTLFKNLSTAPQVSQNLIDMTNALANLASQGRQVGTVSNALSRNFNSYSTAANRANKSSMNLARAIGLMYAKYFYMIRAIKGLWNSATKFMDFTETVNYFEVAIKKIGESASVNYREMGYDNATDYADSFNERMRVLQEKMTGFNVDAYGNIKQSDLFSGLGMNPNTTMQYTAMFAQIADGIGMTEEASIALSEAFVKLGADWSSLRNTSFADAYTKLASGLSGQSRALRAFGVDITNATLQELAYEIGLEKTVSTMTQAEKSYLRTIAVLEQSTVAYGDLANTISSPANQMRLLNQGLENTATLLGTLFMPAINKTLPVLNAFIIVVQRTIITIADLLGIEMGEINSSLGGMEDGFYDLTEDVDDATDAVNKFVKSARPIDELNLLSNKNGDSGLGGDIDYDKLLERYYHAINKYNEEWDKAYKQMENKAGQIADSIMNKFNIKEFAENIATLVYNISDFNDAVSPFVSGIRDGFIDYLKKLSQISFDTLNKALGLFTNILNGIDPETLKKIGEGIGVLIGYFITVKSAVALYNVASSLAKGIALIGTTIIAHPVLSTFVLAGGIISLIAFLKDDSYSSTTAQAFSDDLNMIISSLNSAKDNYDESNSVASQIQKIYDKWNALQTKQGELTDDEKTMLLVYKEELEKKIPSIVGLIDETGHAYAGVSDEIEKLVNNTMTLLRIQGAKDYLSALSSSEIELELNVDKVKGEVQELRRFIETEFKMNSATNFAMNYNGINTDELIELLTKGSNLEKSLANHKYSISSDVMDSVKKYAELTQLQAQYESELQSVRNDISTVTDKYIKMQKEYYDATNDVNNVTKEVVENSVKAKEALDDMPDALKEPISESKKLSSATEKLKTSLDKTTTSAKDFYNQMTNISGLKSTDITVKVKTELDTSTLNKNALNALFGGKTMISAYATGGFPEDGWFRASHGEIMGKFDNGQSVVANNQQITQGIAQAVKSAMLEAFSSADIGGNTVIQIDGKEVFSVVRKEAKSYQNRTGAFAF